MTKTRNDADVAFIESLAELLQRNDLTEIAVRREYGESDTLDVRVSRHLPAPAAVAPAAAATQAAEPPPAAAAPAPLAPDDPAQHPGAVTSPMVGTAYLSPEPGSDPFVTIGSEVTEGEPLMIIEAMKTMNQIPAPHSGTVRRILVTDSSPVEYGAPLMIVE